MTDIAAGRMPAAASRQSLKPVELWLWGILALLCLMIVVGGLTRLTDSGLSIVEWRPVTGTFPPLNEAQWLAELEKYRSTTEYQLQNKGMTLDQFKVIYLWEWGHRFLGRLIGLAFFVPFAWFWATGRVRGALTWRLAGLFVLGGLQGALGWYMVASGLTGRLDVSQYRLAAHLGLAFVIFGAIFWTILDLRRGRFLPGGETAPVTGAWPVLATVLAALIYLQIVSGAFVAGTDAGLMYNTWPDMNGKFAPDGLWFLSPWWMNHFENLDMIQFQHRMLAYLIGVLVLAAFVAARRSGKGSASAHGLLAMTLVQIALGILTVLYLVPPGVGAQVNWALIALPAIHQFGAVLLLATALNHVHALKVRHI
jgi:heme a synthase